MQGPQLPRPLALLAFLTPRTARQVEFFQGPHAITNPNLFTAGGATSGAVSGLGQLYTWGQIKKVGESQVRSPGPHHRQPLGW